MSKYLDDVGLTEVLVKMKGILATKASIAAIPTKISSLDNDSQYQTKAQVTAALPKNVSELTNDSEYQTKTQVQNLLPTKTSELENDSNYQTSVEVSSAISSAISENISSINSTDSEVEGSYVSSVNQSKGVITTTKTVLPTVNDTAVSGQYVSAVSQDKGKISITRESLPTKVSELENDSSYQTDTEVNSSINTILKGIFKSETNYVANFSEKVVIDAGFRANAANEDEAIFYVRLMSLPDSVKSIVSDLQTAGTVPTTDSVASQIATALDGVTGIEFVVVDSLPATPTKGTIYLVPKGTYDSNSVTVSQTDSSGNTVTDVMQDSYDEYIWVSESTTDGVTTYNYEKIGSTDVDLSQYAKTADVPTKTSELTNDSGFVTSVPTKVSELENDSNYMKSYSGLTSIESVETSQNRETIICDFLTDTSQLIPVRIYRNNVTDTEVDGQYVSAVSQKNDKISVTRKTLPSVNDTATSGQYVSAVSQSNGEISVTKASLPSVNDTVTSGQYVSAVSQSNGEISVTKASLPSVNDTAVSGQYVSMVSQSSGKISVARSSLPSVTDISKDGYYISSVSQSNGKISVGRTAFPTMETLSNDTIDSIFTEVFG